MNEEQFKALCESCERLLLMPSAGPERVAIPWLHVIRAHPTFLRRYRGVFESNSTVRMTRRIRGALVALRNFSKASLHSGVSYGIAGELSPKCDVLFVSHLLSASFLRHEADFYYGSVASELAEQGINSTFALINHTGRNNVSISGSSRHGDRSRVIFASVLSLSEEWALYRRARCEASRLNELAIHQPVGLDHSVLMCLAVEAISGGTLEVLRLGEQIKKLVAKLQPRAIVVTYEGHSWERIAFASARAIYPGIRCIGYQHSALFHLQHAIFGGLSKEYNPDVILTSGTVAQKRLRGSPKLANVQIYTLGSIRSVARQPLRKLDLSSDEECVCLVLPEGDVEECNLLFGFSLECARIMPNAQFIWRLHPSIDFSILARLNSAFRNPPSNIRLSSNSLVEDIDRSHWALYRGSTSIVQAAVSGIRPVYLHQVGEIPIDPLYEIAELHARVVEPGDFKAIVAEVETEDTLAKAEKVQDYCEQMFTPMNTRVLAACIPGNSSQKSSVQF